MTGVNRGDPGVFRKTFDVGGEVLPVLTTIARHLHIAIISAYPDQIRIFRRFTNRKDRRVHFCGRIVDGNTAGLFLLLFFRIVRRQIR